jgi:sigma-54 specific flagellar transcriptional regulator A
VADRKGRFELAHNGCIFLDEIGDLPLELQVKLLRVLQERSIDPLGSNKAVAIDVRVIAATHRNLEVEIEEGRFREDLYYRLNVLPLHMPALRERTIDVPLLLDFFVKKFAAKDQQPVQFCPDFAHALQAYHWPGNVRELSNLIDRFSTLFSGQRLELRRFSDSLLPKGLAKFKAEVNASEPLHSPSILGDATQLQLTGGQDSVPASDAIFNTFSSDAADAAVLNATEQISFLSEALPVLPPEGLSLKHRLAEIERDLIAQALSRAKGNVSQTARILNVQRTTLIEKIQKFGLRTA